MDDKEREQEVEVIENVTLSTVILSGAEPDEDGIIRMPENGNFQ